jgi:hypothetical protein
MASKTSCCLKYLERIALKLNALSVTGVVFLNLPPIVNALGVSRITSSVSLTILVSLIVLASFFTPINSTNVYIFIFFQEQGRRNDLFSKGVSPVPQDDSHLVNSTKTIRSLLSTPGISTNIKSESDHCDPLSCMASGSRCHTADYLKETKDVDGSLPCLSSSLLLKSPSVSTNIKSDSDHCDPLSCVASGSRCHIADYLKEMKGVESSVPCLMYSHSKPPPPGSFKSCANSSLRTQCAAVASADAHFATVFHRRLRRARKKRRKQDQHLREMIVPPNQVKMSNAEINSKILVVDGGGGCHLQYAHHMEFGGVPALFLLSWK